MMHMKKFKFFTHSKVLVGSLFGALCLSLLSPMPTANAATFNCGTSGTYTVTNGEASGGANCVGDVTFDSSVTSVAGYSFERARLGAVVFSSGMTSVGNYAFYLSTMTSLTLNANFRTIGTAAFAGNGMTGSMILPSGMTTVAPYAFQGQPFSAITIPSTVTTIGSYAFSGAYPSTLIIPSGVTSIGEGAFASANPTDLRLPSPRPTLGTNAFLSLSASKGSFCLTNNENLARNNTTTGSYLSLTLPNAIDTPGTSNDFTIASWLKTTKVNPGGAMVVGIGTAYPYGDAGFSLFINGNPGSANGYIALGYAPNGAAANGSLPAANTWFHLALVRRSGVLNIYKDGVSILTLADTKSWTSTSLKIGVPQNGIADGFPGCFAGLVQTNSALYTGNFASNLPYPSDMSAPSGAQVFLNPDFSDALASWNKISGGPTLSKTGSISLSNNIPVRPLLNVTPTFTKSSASLLLGQTETFTATVTAGATGTVVFKDGSGGTLCTITSLDASGTGVCGWTPSSVGTYVVTAYYSGDSAYSATTSATQSVSVTSVITYSTNDGVGTAPTQSVYSGTAITLPTGTGLSKSGYTFGGWSLTETGTALTSPYSPSASRTLYAVWTGNQYTITYNANGGSGSQTAGSYTTGAAATTLPATSTFSRTGYSFGGWATSTASTTPVASYSTSATTTFYAIWTRGTYNVRFLANGGVGSMETQTSSATANLTTNAFTFADRTFTGWNTSADGTGIAYSNSQSYPFLANLTLYARWGNLISFSSQGATSGSPSFTSQSWTSGAINLATVGTMVKTGYTFGGWTNGTTTYAGGASYTPTTGITLNPVWNAVTYTISYNSNLATGGTVPSNQSWTTGATALTLSGNPGTLVKSGYTFGGWATTASSTTPVTTYSTSANRIFYAIWSPVDYTITYALAGGTSTLPTQANQRISNSFTLAATPTRAGYNFAGWSDSRTAYGALATYTITASTPSAVTLTAQWIPVYTVSYILNGSTDSVTAPTLYDSGTVISLAAAPTLTGHTFAGWVDSSNNLRAASSSFTVVANSTLQARWTAISYSVTYNLGGASGTLPLQSSLTINQNFQVAPTPIRAGYIFTGWSESSTVYAAGSTYVIASSNVLLTAQWEAIAYAVTFDLGGGVGTLPTQGDGFIGSTFALPSAGSNPTWIAHTFTGWSDGSALYAAGSTYTFSAADVTLTAQFSLNGYTQINYSLGSFGLGALPTQSSKLEGNTIIVASGAGITRANYAFAGWSDGTATYQPGDVYLVGPEAAPVTFVPSWTSGYNVSYSTGSGFGIAPVDPVGRITGSTFTVASSSTVSRQGFTFTGWSDGSANFAPGATYTVASSNITLTAQWVQNSLAGIPSGALTPLANFSIVNGVGPAGSFNFGSSSVSYEIPVNALSAGTVISIYGLTDFSSLASVVPSDKTVISSTVISWLGTDGTVQDTNSPIKMTITDSQIVPGSVVYAVTGGELTLLGTATTNGSITTTIVSDPVILIANPVVVNTPAPTSGGGNVAPAPVSVVASTSAPVSVVVDNSVALAAAAKEIADKKAAEEAAALKAAAEAKVLAEAKAAEEAALIAAQEKMAADAKALAEAKAAADAAAIKAAQDAADASAKAAAALQAAKDAEIAAANAAKAIKPAVTLYSLSSSLKLNSYDSAYLNKYVKSLKNGASVTCIGYSYSKNTTVKKATALAKSQATAVCALMKKTNKTLKTSVVVYPATKAPKAATGAKWVGVSYRIDGFKN
jgi:uncharacterized repeat protein (TIGR02543 family)